MKPNNFERELPDGYRVVKTIDAKSKKLGIIFNSIAFLVVVAVVAMAFIPLLINTERLEDAEDVYFLGFFLLVSIFVYMILHEIVHGIAYKVQTGEKLTFGLSWSCAFCGVPKIFTYRKTALISVLAPLVVFTIVFIPLLIISYFINANIYLMLAVLFGLHLGGSSGDIYVAYLLLVKYKDDTTLMNDTGPKMTMFVYDEALKDVFDEKTEQFINEFNQSIEDERSGTARERKKASNILGSKIVSIIGIVLFSIGAILNTMFVFLREGMLYENPYKFYESVGFYLAIISAVGIVLFALSLKRFLIVKSIIVIILVFIGPILLLLGALDAGRQASYTTDINNYGVYDYPEYMPDYFPKEITDKMTPVKYSYYFDYSWDWCYELYLEVEMTEEEYQSYKTKYENELVECWYDKDYKEYIMSDELNHYNNQDGEDYANGPWIEKIIFNDDDKVVIFWALCGIDPFYYENSAFFESFSVDPQEYEKMTKEEEK